MNKTSDDNLVSIGVAAKALGIEANTLRKWDKEGSVKPAWVSPKGHRRYRLSEVLSYAEDMKAEARLKTEPVIEIVDTAYGKLSLSFPPEVAASPHFAEHRERMIAHACGEAELERQRAKAEAERQRGLMITKESVPVEKVLETLKPHPEDSPEQAREKADLLPKMQSLYAEALRCAAQKQKEKGDWREGAEAVMRVMRGSDPQSCESQL